MTLSHGDYVKKRDEILDNLEPAYEEPPLWSREQAQQAIDALFLEMVSAVDSNCMDCSDTTKLRTIIKGDTHEQ